MEIKRTINFSLRKLVRKATSYQIRMRVSFNSLRDDYIIGHSLTDEKDWDEINHLVRIGAV